MIVRPQPRDDTHEDRDPSQRLATIVMQRKARALLDRQDEFFLDDAGSPDSTMTPEKQ